MRLTKIFLLLIVMAASSQAFAAKGGGGGIFIKPQVFYWSNSTTAAKYSGVNASTPVQTWTFLNGKIGYAFSSGLLVAGVIDSETYSNSTSSTSNYNRASYGAAVGFTSNGWSIIASYLFSSTITSNGTTPAKWDPGTGIHVDLGYVFMLGSNFGLGPALSYRSWTYTGAKTSSGSNVNNSNLRTNDILPMISMMIDF